MSLGLIGKWLFRSFFTCFSFSHVFIIGCVQVDNSSNKYGIGGPTSIYTLVF